MSHKILSFLFIALCFGFVIAPQAAFSQEPEEDGLGGVFPRDFYAIDLLQDLTEREGTFIMRLYNLGEVTGCADLTSSRGRDKMNSSFLKVDVRDSRLVIRKREPRYSNYDCEIKRHSAYADVRLNRDKLIRDNVEKISIESDKYGPFTSVEMKITEDRVEIYDGTAMIGMWFFPKNTVLIQARDAATGTKGLVEAIKTFGDEHGLIPMEEVLEDYYPPHNAHDYVLFVDNKNFVRNKLKTVEDKKMVGALTMEREVHGPNGLETESYDVHLTARIPGEDFDWYKRTRRKRMTLREKEKENE